MNWRTLHNCLRPCWAWLQAGCNDSKPNYQAEAPPPLKVQKVEDRNLFKVDHPDQFALTDGSAA